MPPEFVPGGMAALFVAAGLAGGDSADEFVVVESAGVSEL